MLLLGNDVVDLGDPDTRDAVSNSRFRERVFTDSENSYINEQADPHRQLWQLWAAKEAAFKAWQRQEAELVFAWREFVVDPEAGTITHNQARLHLSYPVSTDDSIHALAYSDSMPAHGFARQEVSSGVLAESTRVREWTLAELSELLSTGVLSIESVRHGPEKSLPRLLCDGRAVPGVLTLSHHGRVMGYAWSAS